MKQVSWLLFLFFLFIVFQGCRSLNPSVMLKTGKDYKYSAFPVSPLLEYKIASNDELSFSIFSNDGFKMIDITAMAGGTGGVTSGTKGALQFKVEFDGTVKLPLLGRIAVKGLTIREAELFLEEKYSAFYNKPFVLVEVTNKKAIIFPGSAGTAKVIDLKRENTTLLEALADAGGIAQSGKAYDIKLIRGDLKNPEVFLIDLSTIEGMKKADLVLQANDIIYVTPHLRIGTDVIGQILPYLSFITTMIVFYELISTKTP
jgi:polysaccharide export outer membrane protein